MRENILIILLLLVAAAVCYNAVLDAGFIWDDEYIVLQNPLIRAPLGSFQIFRQDIINSGFHSTVYYRPIQILSYAIDYRLWGMSSSAFHGVNVFLHFLNGVLVFFFTWKITGEKVVSLLAAMLFVIHPVHAGAVSYISSRTDLLFFFFGFLCMLFYVFFVQRRRYILLGMSVFCLVLALLSKEAAVVFPLLLLLLDATVLRGKYRSRLAYHVPNFFAAGGYIALHHFIFSQRHFMVFSPGAFASSIVKYFRIVREFLVLGFFPVDMHMRRGLESPGVGLLPVLVGIFFIFSFVFLRNRRRILLFALGFFLIALVPFFFVTGYFKVVAEHWMYLASYGLFLFTATALVTLYQHRGIFGRSVVAGVILLVIVYCSANTIRQNVYWREDVSLSDRVLAFSAQDMPAMHYKAVSYLKSGRDDEMMEIMDEYAKNNPRDARAWYIKGRLTLAAGKTEEAEQDFKEAVRVDPTYDNGYMGLALAAFIKGQSHIGIEYLEQVIEINPKHSEALLILGSAYSEAGQNQKSLQTAKKAVEINPYDYDSLVNLGTAYTRQGYLQEGARYYLEATRLYPERPLAYYNLAHVFLAGGQEQEAAKWLRKALDVDPSFTPAIELLHKMRSDNK
ncbi:MAG: tetratricopeptide repeat protein [Candidatus Omnitrophota bacterium]